MTTGVYPQRSIQLDLQTDHWGHVQHHIRELHTFLTKTGAVNASVVRQPVALINDIAAVTQLLSSNDDLAATIPETSALTSDRRTLLNAYLDQLIQLNQVHSLCLPGTNEHYELPLRVQQTYCTPFVTDATGEQVSVFALLREQKHLTLVGPEGSGKTATIAYLVTVMASAIREPEQQATLTQQIEGWQRGPRLPVHVQLTDAIAGSSHRSNPLDLLWQGVRELATLSINSHERALLCDTLQQTLRRGQGMLLIDGFGQALAGEEVARTIIDAAHTHYGASPILIAQSSASYTTAEAPLSANIASALLSPLDRRGIDALVCRWYRELALQGSYDFETAQLRARNLCTTIHSNPRMHELAATPRNLGLMVLVHSDRGELPKELVKRFWMFVA